MISTTSRPATVLVHLASGIGNIVLATPLLVALNQLAFVTDVLLDADYPATADLLRDWSVVRTVYPGAAVSSVRFDEYAHLLPAIPPFYWRQYSRLYVGSKHALSRPPDSLFYTNEQRYYLEFARRMGYAQVPEPFYSLPVVTGSSTNASDRTVAIAPGCKTGEMAAKRWPYFPQLAECFPDVALVGTGDDLGSQSVIGRAFPGHVRSFVDRLTLRETVELMASAGVVVGNDSGLCHAAAATGTPTVMLFGPTPHLTLGRLPPNVTVLRSGLPCEPCWADARLRACSGRLDCLRQLVVERVEDPVRTLLGMERDLGKGRGADVVRQRVQVAAVGETGPLVSCVMPTCNRRAFVPRAVSLFLRQDYANRELIVLDDGTDPVQDLLPADPRIRYERLDAKRTLGAKRNVACEHARGEFIVHWDDDDWMAEWRLSYQLRGLLQNSSADVCGLHRLFFYDAEHDDAWEYIYPPGGRTWVAGGTMCYRRAFWQRHRFPEVNEGEDTRFLWGAQATAVVSLPDNTFYVAMIHPENTSRKRIGGPRWHRRPPSLVHGLMGAACDAVGA